MGWSEKYKKSINCDNPKGFSQRAHCQGRKKKMQEAKEQDHEVSMAQTQLKKSEENIRKLRKALGKKEKNIPAWVQAKITDTEHNTDAASSYMSNDVSEQLANSQKDQKGMLGKTVSPQTGKGTQYLKKPVKGLKVGTTKSNSSYASGKVSNPDEVFEAVDASQYGGPDKLLKKLIPKYGGGEVVPQTPKKSANVQNAHYEAEGEYIEEKKKGGTLYNWFKKSKSKDGKPGWVQSDGSPCANEPGETKTPKCYSSRRLAGLKKTEEGKKKIRSADARKSQKDPGQQQKSGGAAPTMVRTFTDKKDYKKHKSGDYSAESFELQEARDIKGKGSGKKDACYHKVKSRYDVWPSAYASGALVKCRKVGADNWGNKSESFQYSNWRLELREDWQKVNKGDKTDGMSQKAVNAYRRENPGSKLKTAVTEKNPGPGRSKRRKSFCARSKGQQDMHNIDCSKTPDKAICKARRRWRC